MLEVAVIYLAAAIVAVPIAKRLGLGSVLGYLLAGMLIGPFVLGIVGDQSQVMHFAEFGVVMMLFLVGLELQPARLWKLRHSIVGLGGLQVTITALQLKVIARAIDRRHAYQLLQLGVTSFRRETFDSSVYLGVEALKLLGNSIEAAEKAGELFRKHDEESLHMLADVWGDDQSYGVAVRQRMEDLRQVLNQDEEQQDQLNACKGAECEGKNA